MNKETLLGVVLIGGVVAYASLGFEVVETLPKHAIVMADHVQQEFATVPCILNGNTTVSYIENLKGFVEGGEPAKIPASVTESTIGEVEEYQFSPDAECANAGGFATPRSLVLNLLGFKTERVDADGNILW
ncbi:hypothetical protein [Mesorhizobium marinum]|uniref:Uncharacterized protein n=1 Tax=Mesorhizobium marinum TaxID=3228790 RepID=A0ABV3R6K1_9HYPH